MDPWIRKQDHMVTNSESENDREAILGSGELISFSPSLSVKDSNNLVLAFCLDGTVYALESKTGAIKWRISGPFTEGPLLKKSSKGAYNNFSFEYIIEPLGDGAIFQMGIGAGMGDVKRLPFTLKSLVHLSPLHWKEDADRSIYLIAKRESSIFVLDLLTGKVEKRQFALKNSGEIDVPLDTTETENLQLSKLGPTSLLIGRSDYHVQGFSEDNLDALWEISLTQFKSLHGMTSLDSDSESSTRKYDFYTTFNGHLVSKQATGPWVTKLASPILQIFRPVISEKGFISLQEIHFKSSESLASASQQHIQFDHTKSTFYFEDLVNIGVLEDATEKILFVLPQACYPVLRDRTPKLSLEGGIENVDSDQVSTSLILNKYTFLSSQRVSRRFMPLPVKLLDDGSIKNGSNFKFYGTVFIFVASVIFLWIRFRNSRRKKTSGSSGILEVSDEVLGYGSHGTVVFRGKFDGRAVAVKRLLAEFYSLADREINLLLNHDVHPNIIRYFYREKQEKFILVALELADCTLQEYINPTENFEISSGNCPEDQDLAVFGLQKSSKMVAFKGEIETNNILAQIMRGIEFLHEKGLVHRDLKPQNILLQLEENPKTGKRVRVLISDFGLSKKLVEMESSFHATAKAAGTLGWRAPEIILNDEAAKFRDFSGSNESLGPMKISKSVDIFAAGLVFYFVLSGGGHAFGPRLARESNISAGKLLIESKYLSAEADDLIRWMLSRKPKDRPTALQVLQHPFFWSHEKRLDFICTVSDVLEAEERNAKREQTEKAPPGFEAEFSVDLPMRDAIDSIGEKVYPNNSSTWHREIDRIVFQDLTKHRYYMVNKLHDLLRAIRNKRNHFHETPAEVQSVLGASPQESWKYFERKFPMLLMESYRVMKAFSCGGELPVLRKFYE